jgi:hypothetical protein
MYLSEHSNVGDNKFLVKIKINHKVRKCSCMHAVANIFVMTGFDEI